MFYDRKVKYFDYMADGERLKGGGFVKLEARDTECRIILQISGLQETDSSKRKVYIVAEEQKELLCEVQLVKGRGGATLNLQCNDLRGGISYEQVKEIQIPISPGKELVCTIAEKSSEREHEVHKEREQDAYAAEVPKEEKAEDKWQQLSSVYPHISPFQDKREYLSIGPGDFVILSQKYYKLVNNSFLLHGFYNYKHLILARVEAQGDIRYYIGVPGNFYEREKQVALMFGFESFECREEPALTGDFGYYMMQVEI